LENERLPPEYRITFGEKPEGITMKEYRLLYIETLYTIKHKIGSSTPNYNVGENELYAYAQEAFGLSSEEHRRLLEKASEEKVRLTLHVRIECLPVSLASDSDSEYRSSRSQRSRSERRQW
jgi:hypothetical protein